MNHIINTIYLGYIILWPIFFNFILHIDGAGRIYMLLSALMILFNIPQISFRKAIKEPAVYLWLIWLVYTILNWLRAGYSPVDSSSSLSFIFLYLIIPWLALWVTVYEARVRPKILLKNLLLFFSIYVFLGFILQIGFGVDGERGGTILGNTLPLISLCLVFVSCLSYNLKIIKLPLLSFCIIISFTSILMAATRKAFVGELIILFFFLLTIFKKLNFKSLIGLLFIFFLVYFSLSFVLENSVLGTRFTNLSEEAARYNTTDSFLLSLLGDRAYFYITGWELFVNNIWFGIGINNYMNVTDYPMPIHSEYMVQLTENGIIGTIIYACFLIAVFKSIKQHRQNAFHKLSLGWFICVLFISFTSWVYDMAQYYMIFGLILGLGYRNKNIRLL